MRALGMCCCCPSRVVNFQRLDRRWSLVKWGLKEASFLKDGFFPICVALQKFSTKTFFCCTLNKFERNLIYLKLKLSFFGTDSKSPFWNSIIDEINSVCFNFYFKRLKVEIRTRSCQTSYLIVLLGQIVDLVFWRVNV